MLSSLTGLRNMFTKFLSLSLSFYNFSIWQWAQIIALLEEWQWSICMANCFSLSRITLNRLSSDYIRNLIDAHRLQLHFVYVVFIIKMINVSFFLWCRGKLIRLCSGKMFYSLTSVVVVVFAAAWDYEEELWRSTKLVNWLKVLRRW